LGAFVDIALHFLQLFPKYEPSLKFTCYLTLGGAALMALSCVSAPNAAALVMSAGIAGMALYSLVTGKEVH
jgi:hypothetical protein